jgi:hypothetical protein
MAHYLSSMLALEFASLCEISLIGSAFKGDLAVTSYALGIGS